MSKHTFNDPIGPGTPAWRACDLALEARLEYWETKNPRLLKRYYNQRQYCIELLTKLGAPQSEVDGWINFMRIRLGEIEG